MNSVPQDFPPGTQGARAIELLQRSLDSGRLGHAYLFHASQSPPLESAARTLAQTLNCSHPPKIARNGTPILPCGACPNCRRTQLNEHPDVLWVRPESKMRQISVDATRQLIHALSLKPALGGWKIGVVCHADRMNSGAANAFLKTLEEPPPRSVLILLSTQPDRLLETILSRCLRLCFGNEEPEPDPLALRWVEQVAQLARESELNLLSRYQVLLGLVETLAASRKSIEESLAAASPLERYPDVESAQKERWEAELAAAIDAEYRHRRNEICGAFQWWLRDLWLLSNRASPDQLRYPKLAPDSQIVAQRLQPSAASQNLVTWTRLQQILHTNVQESLALEVALLELHL